VTIGESVSKSLLYTHTLLISANAQFGTAFDILLSSEIKTEPPFASYEEVGRVVSAAFEEVLNGKDVDAALEELTEEANFINEDMMP
jgi:hypothetical protein